MNIFNLFKREPKLLSPNQAAAIMAVRNVAVSDDMLEDIILICTGTAHARRYPAKKGDRGFRMEGGML